MNNKTDANDSVAIAEDSQRPRLHAVPAKSVAQQGLTMLHSLRQQALKVRTQWYNSIRSHLSERGLVTRRSRSHLDALIEEVLSDDPALQEGLDLSQVSDEFRIMLAYEADQLRRVCEKVGFYTDRIEALDSQLDEVRRLRTVPGIGSIVSSALVAVAGDADGFGCG